MRTKRKLIKILEAQLREAQMDLKTTKNLLVIADTDHKHWKNMYQLGVKDRDTLRRSLNEAMLKLKVKIVHHEGRQMFAWGFDGTLPMMIVEVLNRFDISGWVYTNYSIFGEDDKTVRDVTLHITHGVGNLELTPGNVLVWYEEDGVTYVDAWEDFDEMRRDLKTADVITQEDLSYATGGPVTYTGNFTSGGVYGHMISGSSS